MRDLQVARDRRAALGPWDGVVVRGWRKRVWPAQSLVDDHCAAMADPSVALADLLTEPRSRTLGGHRLVGSKSLEFSQALSWRSQTAGSEHVHSSAQGPS